jgi:hypothetical protein
VLAGGWCACSSDDAHEPPTDEPPAARPVSARGLTEHLRALDTIARENGGERATGTPGYDASVRYVAARLRESGWRVTVQQVPLRVPSERSPAHLSVASRDRLKPLTDFRLPTYSGAGAGRGRVSRVGSGCARSDYAALERGAVALADAGGCLMFEKARNAARASALALLLAGEWGARGVPSATLVSPARLPVLLVGRRAERALGEGSEVALRVDTEVSRATTQNVIAEAGGGDRVAMAGAHLDSVPDGPGINDNASGVATLLEAADALGARPKGRVRLAFWGAEELGLVGSRHYVRALPREQLRRIAAYINLDMVGSPNAVPAIYSDGDRRLGRLLHKAHPGRETGVAVEGSSDHAPFADSGIPVNGLYTGSAERGPGGRPRDSCYHLSCDTLANVDRRVLLGMARATVRALREVEDEP